MRGIVSSPELIHWSPNPQYLRMRLYLGIGPLKKKVQMRPLEWALIQSDWSYMKRKFLYTGERPGIHTHIHRKIQVRTQREGSHLQAKDRGLSRSQTCQCLDPGFSAPRMVRNFCLHHIVWYFVMAKLIQIYQQIDTNTIKILRALSPLASFFHELF